MRSNSVLNHTAFALAAVALAVAGCDKVRPVSGAGNTSCTGCHGGLDNSSGAPPFDTAGKSDTTRVSVGAHTAHLSADVECSSCHKVPARIRDPNAPEHINGQVEVTFGGVALLPAGSARPTFDPVAGTCSNVYCHGAKLPPSAQGEGTTPTWTGNPPALVPPGCSACHGTAANSGAPSGHSAGLVPTDCNRCHPDTVASNGTIVPARTGGKHIDGHVDISSAACTQCHGDATRDSGLISAAPPKDTAGQTTGAKVGAHLRHVSSAAGLSSRLSRPFSCTECHQLPNGFEHAAAPVVRFATATSGNLANLDGLVPQYTGGTCSNVYCHGTNLAGGTKKNPAWTDSYASAGAECGTCHFAASPPSSHPQVDQAGAAITATTQCGQCHPGTVNQDGTINLTLGLHVNGLLDVNPHAAGWVAASQHGPAAKLALQSCATSACHGATFGNDVGGGKSCNTCHANPVAFVPGWTGAKHPTWQTECTFCHGQANRADVAAQATVGTPAINAAKAAPPLGSQDESALSANAVGAHLRHASDDATAGNRLSVAIRCQQCHGTTLPANVAHVDGQIVIGWQLAAQGISPTPAAGSYPRSAASPTPVSCANYCHGATLTGGTKTTVSWTGVGTAGCGSCHALPPAYVAPGWHPVATDCTSCHGYDGTSLNKTLHVNGTLDLVAGLTCHSCHGSATNNAPPRAASANVSASSDPRVGAHQAHLVNSNLRSAALACTDCHGTLPTSMTHANGAVTVAWSSLASTGGITPSPTAGTVAPGATATCANYCHGASFAGQPAYVGSITAPSWTGGVSQAACGTCHKAPPSSSAHSGVTSTTNCGTCHTGYNCTTANLAACTVNKTAHLNGTLDAPSMACNTCHGSATNNAPPVATTTTNSAVKVGAHQKHVTGTALRSAALGCADCHTVPTSGSHSSGTVDMTWGTLARTGSLTPTPGNLGPATTPTQATWEAAPTCTNYCHGNFSGGLNASPSWTAVGPLTCNACHGQGATAAAQPPGPISATIKHPQSAACADCHTGYTATTVNAAVHIDGTRSFPAGCTACHGELNAAVAPKPVANTSSAAAPGYGATATAKDSKGNTATSSRGVGAHDLHLRNLTFRGTAIACGECHVVPATADLTHVTGTPVVTFGTLARTAWAGQPAITPVWNGAGGAATLTCSSTYCHGNFGGGAKASPTWAPPTTVTCGSCHGIPPTFQKDGVTAHAASTACASCHGGTYTSTSVDLSLHMNGVLDVAALACNTCHGSATNNAPPVATTTVNSAVKIGAHQAHVVNSNLRSAALGCADCHTVPTSTAHSSGIVDMTWGTLARTGTITPTPANLGPATTPTQATWEATPTCTNYCHGASFAGQAAYVGSIAAPSWTGGSAQAACGTCHKAPPTSSAHSTVTSTTNCGSCHAGYSCTTANLAACTVNKTTHLNGTLDAPSMACNACHGSATNNAPPAATTTTNSAVKIGAHQAHLVNTTLRSAALGCAECHTVPSSAPHASGTVDMTWGALARTGSLTPAPASLGPATTPTQATWEASPTCTNYCHGQTMVGGTLKTPSWTGTSTASACTACHGAPPDYTAAMSGGRGYHPPNATCGSCHTGSTITAPAKATHINGTVEVVALTCHSCHGSATNNAPPTDTTGGTVAARVGAHQAHVVGKTYTDGLGGNTSCTECHGALPTANTHASGAVNIGWGTIATTNATPTPAAGTITPASAITCTNYCHNVKTRSGGATGGSVASITWTATISACNSCHAIPSSGGRHTSVGAHRTTCNTCHPAAYSSTTVDLALHVNGVRNVTATGWNATNQSCGNNGSGCHGSGTKGPW